MNETTTRALLVAGLSANILFLVLSLLDYSLADSQYIWPVFVAWGFVILLLVLLAFVQWRSAANRNTDPATPALARAVAALAARPTDRPTRAPAPVEAAPTPTAAPTPLVELESVPFVYNGYTLHSRSVALKNGGDRTIWFFSKRTPSSGKPAAKPAGFHVGVNERTGLPFLKKGTGADGEDLTPAAAEDAYRPQCSALRNDGVQCRNSARTGSKYCASHFGYQPRTAEGVVRLTDTTSQVARINTATSFSGDKTAVTAKGAQCQALTGGGLQCKNTVRPGSQFCVSHKGYRSPSPTAVVARRDSRPRVAGAPDTLPSVRRRASA